MSISSLSLMITQGMVMFTLCVESLKLLINSKSFGLRQKKQLGKHIKALRSDRGGEYFLGDFKDHLSEAGIISQLTTPGTPQQNGVSERRNRTLLEMVRAMMSYAALPMSFWGYALQTAAYLLNLVPSKSVSKVPTELWIGRKPSIHYIHVWGCPAHVLKGKSDKLESKTEVCLLVGYPKGTKGYLFYSPEDKKVFVATNARFLEEDYVNNFKPKSREVLDEMIEAKDGSSSVIPEDDVVVSNTPQVTTEVTPEIIVPRRSGRIVRAPDRFMFLGEVHEAVSDELESDPRTYDEAVNDTDADQWVKAMENELESMYSNNVWTLVKAPNGIKPIGCKWVYKRKRGVDGKVETFKARLVAKGFTQKEGIDYEETFSPVAMLKSIRILLAIAAHLDYEIWQMDVKTAFLNGQLDEDIYMMQPDGFIAESQGDMVCKLQRSIYGLKQASRSWNIRFDETIKQYGFEQNLDEPCVYKRCRDNVVTFLVLYVDDILLIGNDVGTLSAVRIWLSKQFDMKDLGEASYILGIKLLRDRKNRMIGLSQSAYIDKVLARFNMLDSKKGMLPFRHGVALSKDQCPQTSEMEE
jgi:hypothetical protein